MYNWKKSVAADLFEDEFIIVDLNSGLYYSVQGLIVNVLAAMPFASVKDTLAALDGKISADHHEDILGVWDELLKDKLVDDSAAGPANSSANEFVTTDSPCKLAKYADMQDLIALDPIHEVDEEGWPEVASD